jgi:hypothetical protein
MLSEHKIMTVPEKHNFNKIVVKIVKYHIVVIFFPSLIL